MTGAEGGPQTREGLLNQECFCITLDRRQLDAALGEAAADHELGALLAQRQHLFSNSPVFISKHDLATMLSVVRAIERVAETPLYRKHVLGWAPEIAQKDFGPRGAFMGYDFHLGRSGPRLIEVNTNAGGAFLNAVLARGQSACCREAKEALGSDEAEGFDAKAWAMFMAEWQVQGRSGQPRSVAIVDERPKEQYLYPEFRLAQSMFERRGLHAVITDPAELSYEASTLTHHGRRIDLVYNRLVDFDFALEANMALRDAYLAGVAVVTPNPRNHAVMADKRNLTVLSDPKALLAMGVSEADVSTLSAVPRTLFLEPASAEVLWAERKRYFFKPSSGHGGKAVYRGDKITRGVWATISSGGYIAQEIAQPSERRIRIDGEEKSLKLDVRLYTYRGDPLLAAARVYQGQTTNFRTPGGGFAPVYAV